MIRAIACLVYAYMEPLEGEDLTWQLKITLMSVSSPKIVSLFDVYEFR